MATDDAQTETVSARCAYQQQFRVEFFARFTALTLLNAMSSLLPRLGQCAMQLAASRETYNDVSHRTTSS